MASCVWDRFGPCGVEQVKSIRYLNKEENKRMRHHQPYNLRAHLFVRIFIRLRRINITWENIRMEIFCSGHPCSCCFKKLNIIFISFKKVLKNHVVANDLSTKRRKFQF
jgi:hypothetical protein